MFFLILLSMVSGTPLDDYVNKADPEYKWEDTGATFDTTFGGKAYVLNVTSQKWMDTSRAAGPDGDIWTHQVVVIIPRNLKHDNLSLTYLTGGCNSNPSVPKPGDEDVLVADYVSAESGAIAMVVFQIPNCPIVYPSDPSQKRRTEDAIIAWGWHEFLNAKTGTGYEWLLRLPMTKAAMRCMQAVQEFTTQKKLAKIDGFLVAGASKRGWTTWMVGAVTCPTCPNIVAIAPLVPIMPDLIREMHRQWMSYGGWTFAFTDYTAVNLTRHIDDPRMLELTQVVDPIYYKEQLGKIPKMVVLSSDDEFAMLDWTNIWYDDLTGEKHLYIVQDSEHSLSTGILELLPSLSTFVSSIAYGQTEADRPQFDYHIDESTGTLTVKVLQGIPTAVKVWTAKTMTAERRDFRWVRLADNETSPCKLPEIPLAKPVFGGNCIQPILWKSQTLEAPYTYTPPAPSADGKWLGYWIELIFPNEFPHLFQLTHFQVTTPAFVWPNTLPFEDCHGAACEGHLL